MLSHGLGRRYSSEELDDVGVRSILRQEVVRSLQADAHQDRLACEGACEGNCGKSECTCGGACSGDCDCSKGPSSTVVAQVASLSQTCEDPVIASILDDLLV